MNSKISIIYYKFVLLIIKYCYLTSLTITSDFNNVFISTLWLQKDGSFTGISTLVSNVFVSLVPRQLSMMLMLAQSNPQLFALFGTKANINKELERIEQFSKLQQLTAADLFGRNKKHWKEWLEKYR